MEKDLGYKSNVVIAGSNFEERMFIKLAKNRKLLSRESAKKGIWPSTKESGKIVIHAQDLRILKSLGFEDP